MTVTRRWLGPRRMAASAARPRPKARPLPRARAADGSDRANPERAAACLTRAASVRPALADAAPASRLLPGDNRKSFSSRLMAGLPDAAMAQNRRFRPCHMAGDRTCHTAISFENNHMAPPSWQRFYLAIVSRFDFPQVFAIADPAPQQ